MAGPRCDVQQAFSRPAPCCGALWPGSAQTDLPAKTALSRQEPLSRLLSLATALFATLGALVACNNDTAPAKKIIGTWGVDIHALRAAGAVDIPTKDPTAGGTTRSS